MLIDYTDALAAGWHVFPLYDIVDGKCGCGHPDCQAAGKHPRAANWQHTPIWDADQLEYLEDPEGLFHGNQLIDGHGIAVAPSGLLVVDVDGRNGGWESAKKLQKLRDACGYIVQTGSQNGEHWYFSISPDHPPLVTNLDGYPGIDFKSTGFVVGAYSLHASGHRYEDAKGSPKDVTQAPQWLLDLLKRPQRLKIEGREVSDDELTRIVDHIANPGRDYEMWIRVGMAIHDATAGAGYDLWVRWSALSKIHDETTMPAKWHSFGKSANPVTAGTLIEWARQSGYSIPVTFVDDSGLMDEINPKDSHLLHPPGLVGEIVDWINSRCVMRRERLAVAAALQIVSNAAGMNYLVEGRDTSLNLITIGIAGSRTGKGMIKKCIDEVHAELGLMPAVHGKFKSSQELVRNAIHHQMVIYVYDEFGKQLQKLAGASRSGAHYLEDLMAELIAMYSVATGTHGLSGDVKRELMDEADRKISARLKALGVTDGEDIKDIKDDQLERAYADRKRAEQGIVEPYMTFFGLTEPGAFSAAVEADPWLITGGFLGRALIFEETETVPDEREDFSTAKAPEHIMMRLRALFGAGNAQATRARIERIGDWQRIGWSEEAHAFLRKIKSHWHDAAIRERDSGSGLESQASGAGELAIKVAGILAADSGRIELEHIQWAHELIKDITQDKIERARSGDMLSSRSGTDRGSGLISGVMRHLERLEDGEETTIGRIRNAVGRTKVSTEDVQKALEHLESQGIVKSTTKTNKQNKSFTYYSIAKK